MSRIIKFLILLSSLSLFGLELSKQPEITKVGKVLYPKTMKSSKKEGKVKLFINLTSKGKIKSYGFYKSTDKSFESSIKKGIYKFKFSSAEYKDIPISVKLIYTYNFKLDNSADNTKIDKVKSNKWYKKEKKAIDKRSKDEALTRPKDQDKRSKDEALTRPKDEDKRSKDEALTRPKDEDKRSKDISTAVSPTKKEIAKKEIVKKEIVKKEALVLTKNPILKRFVEAKYPEELRKQEVEGIVTLFIDVDENGNVKNVGVIKSDNENFNKAAVEAVKKFEFTPAEYKDKKVPVRITYQYNFVIKDKKEATKEEIKKAKEEKTAIIEKADYESIRGVILGYGNREPLSYVTVRLISETDDEFETVTDENGKFLFKNLENGDYKIIIDPKDKYLGYETKENIKKGKLVNIKISLPQDLLNPYELTVIKKKAKKEVTKETISVEEIMKIPGTNGDALKVVQNLPGVSRAGGLSGALIIRGNNGLDSRVFIDGHFVPMLYHFGGLTSVFNSELIQDVSYYPGNYSAKYGRALGGIVDVTTKKLKTKKDRKNIHGYLDVDLIDTSAMIDIPIDDKSAVAVAFRRSYIDTILPLILPDSMNDVARALPVYYDWQLKYDYNFSKKSQLSFTHFGSSDNFELFFDKPVGDPGLSGEFSMSTFFIDNIIAWDYKINKKMKSKFSMGLQYLSQKFKISDFIDINGLSYITTMREDFIYKINKDFTLNLGMDNWLAWATYEFTVPDSMPNHNTGETGSLSDYGRIYDKNSMFYFLPAVYTELISEFGQLRLITGLRSDYSSENNRLTLDPRISAIYTLNNKLLFKGGIGQFHQPPQDYQTDRKFGNLDLKNQYSIQYTLGTEYRFTDFINMSFELFYNDQRDLAVTSTKKVIIDGEIVNENFNNDGRGRAYGAEIFLRHNMSSKFFGWISYTIMKAERKDHDWDDWTLFRYDQTHILTMIASYKISNGWQIGTRLRYVTGSPKTPIVNSIYNADSTTYSPIYGEPNSVRNDAFFQLDLRVDKIWQFETWMLSFYLDIQNVTNYANQEGVSYNYDYSESSKVEGIPFFPSIGIKGEF